MSEHAGRPTDESSGGHEVTERVRASFARQGLMRLLGAEVVGVGDGTCVIEVPFAEGDHPSRRATSTGLSRVP